MKKTYLKTTVRCIGFLVNHNYVIAQEQQATHAVSLVGALKVHKDTRMRMFFGGGVVV
jgi:hypothetical protein